MLSDSELQMAKRSVLFSHVPDGMLAELLKDSHKRNVARGATLFVQGDPANHMYVVLSGCVKLVRITPGGEEVVVAVYSEGASFGEAVALKGGTYPVTVDAVQDSLLLQVESRVVFDTLRSDPDLALSMLSSTFNHLHELVMEIESLKALSGAQRLATFLISLAPVEEGPCSLVLPYDKVLIAKRLGMKPESLSRSFANLRKQGVSVKRHAVQVSDIGQLKSFVEDDEPMPGRAS
ncbi:Crp/Fnr family transcriptional regulator [Alisedimentitalea sp. MJ-SS2]|uniref:Crp/Fnr family transcriptional regulator n=1 Tax=Aliisedimentitalea sp. MJ-SS2 TaxID=3049795 RepID=UPI002915909A|nr:Crp/Fnr family transcriptional regulator [Alisedimentitalea sp. MJ-SS2]MDU8928516.1 Crp/Fnr family transcriptional regulator [Alisedimentitalea sp. MJ-SS2]